MHIREKLGKGIQERARSSRFLKQGHPACNFTKDFGKVSLLIEMCNFVFEVYLSAKSFPQMQLVKDIMTYSKSG